MIKRFLAVATLILASLGVIGVADAGAMRLSSGGIACTSWTQYSPAIWNGTGWLEGVQTCWFAGPTSYSYHMAQDRYTGGTVHTTIDVHNSNGLIGNIWNSWSPDNVGFFIDQTNGMLLLGPNYSTAAWTYGGYNVWDPTVSYPTYTWSTPSDRNLADRVWVANGTAFRLYQGYTSPISAPGDGTGSASYNTAWVTATSYYSSPVFDGWGTRFAFA